MLGRPATRIELKMEDDLQEYEEFKLQMQQRKEKERLQQIASAFGGHQGIIGGQGAQLGTHGFEQIASYASYYKDKNQINPNMNTRQGAAGGQRKRRNNNPGPGAPNAPVTGFNMGSGALGGMGDDSMNDSF